MATQPLTQITPEGYLRLDRESDTKHEYIDGQILAMAGGSPRHALVTANVSGTLHIRLRGTGWFVHSPDLRVCVRRERLITYPDVAVVCGTPEFLDDRRDTILNPVVLVEVLSPSTSGFDRGLKGYLYRNVASLREYLLVEPDTTGVEHYRRADGEWIRNYTDRGEAIRLDLLGVELPLEEIYYGVEMYD